MIDQTYCIIFTEQFFQKRKRLRVDCFACILIVSLFTVDTEKQSSEHITFDKNVSGERMETMQDEMDSDRNLACKNNIFYKLSTFVNQRSMETHSFYYELY